MTLPAASSDAADVSAGQTALIIADSFLDAQDGPAAGDCKKLGLRVRRLVEQLSKGAEKTQKSGQSPGPGKPKSSP